MKKLTRKLFISVLVAVFAFVALGTSTYAWITISTTAHVQEFSAKVDAGTAGIELSEDNANWYSVLKLTTDFTKEDFWLDDVTTKDCESFTNFVSNGNQMIEEATTEGFIEETIYIRRSSETTGQTVVNINDVVFENLADAADGVFKYGTTAQVTNLFATNALRMSLVWTNNYDALGNAAEVENKVIYEQNTDDGNTSGQSATGYAQAYAAFQGIELKQANGTDDAVCTTYASGIEVKQAGVASDNTIIIKDDEVIEINVKLWIEGWDSECHANILTQSFSVAFGFKQQ